MFVISYHRSGGCWLSRQGWKEGDGGLLLGWLLQGDVLGWWLLKGELLGWWLHGEELSEAVGLGLGWLLGDVG